MNLNSVMVTELEVPDTGTLRVHIVEVLGDDHEVIQYGLYSQTDQDEGAVIALFPPSMPLQAVVATWVLIRAAQPVAGSEEVLTYLDTMGAINEPEAPEASKLWTPELEVVTL